MQFNVLDARNRLSRLIDAAIDGEDVVIAKRGKPAVRLVRVEHEAALGSSERIAAALERLVAERPMSDADAAAEIAEIKQGRIDE
jgi:prevent-host-death family protein